MEWLLLFVLHDERSRGNLDGDGDGVWRVTEAGYARYRGLLEAFDQPDEGGTPCPS